MKRIVWALTALVILYIIGNIFYYRTGYFESSIIKQKHTFFCHTKDSISSSYFYVDLSGNWILLDKGIVIRDGETGVICICTNESIK
ncbi:hypothetical protein SAMN04489761_3457 [Tenacibaculum sp. MAR_2009_124]|nr:hypothetical protein SAMN04489761_3457 [Tenacibaculum sp. MAR_2009_124]